MRLGALPRDPSRLIVLRALVIIHMLHLKRNSITLAGSKPNSIMLSGWNQLA